MFELGLRKKFRSSHALTGGDWGKENEPHFHEYLLEWILPGPSLGPQNFLADLVGLELVLETVVARYREAFLNDLPVFRGQNPSLEFFAKVLWEELGSSLKALGLLDSKVILWENEWVWASYRGDF